MASKKGSSLYSAPLAKRKFNFSEVEESTPKEMDSIKVYLRVKPHDERQINESNDVFEVTDSNTLLVKATGGSRKFSRGNEEYSYTFTHIFPSDVSQKEVFEKSVKESVVDFVNGFSSLIFSYGTTNAGKTFTIQGTSQQPGLIPRALCLVFNSIEDRQTDDVEYMPCGRIVKRMTENELKNHSELKQIIINHSNSDDSQSSTKTVHKLSQHESGHDFEMMDMILEKETNSLVVLKPASTYSLWISFYEIYNECIYDLLTPPLTSNSQRKHLKIGEDSAKNSFVKDLNYVNVTSIHDARRVLIYGSNNLQVAMTGLNAQSSRSHCIFTLTLVRSPEAAETGDDIVISQLSLCDLAGTERQKKTLNVGERLKESQHINCSLHVLSRCFDIIRENQNRADRCVIPYRESKLTQLFQKALRGEEKIVMMVNINMAFSLDETHQVLKTSAIARKTTTSMKPWQQKKRRSRSAMLRRSIAEHSRGTKSSTLARSTLTEVDVEEDSEYADVTNVHDQSKQIVESLLATIDTQKRKIVSYKNKVDELEEMNSGLEDELRQELAVEYGKLIKTIEDRLKQRIEDKDKVIDEKDRVIAELERRVNCEVDAENGLRQSAKKKRKVFDCSLSMIEANTSHVDDDVAVLREENNLLKNDLHSLKSNLDHYKNENLELSKKYAELKLMRRIENIATLREAVIDEDILRILGEMDNMKEKFEAEVSKRNALIKEAMDEMKYLETDYNEVRTENGKLEGDLLVARDELEDAKRSLAIANQITASKSEENHQLELKLEQLETDNEKLNDYIELAEAEIKCLQQKLKLLERNGAKSVDIFNEDNSIVMNERSAQLFTKLDDNSHNTLCNQLQKVSLEYDNPGLADDSITMQHHSTFGIDSLNSSKQQTAQKTMQSSINNKTEDLDSIQRNCTFDALSINLSKQQTSLNSLQSTLANKTEDLASMQQNCTFDVLSMNSSKQQTSQNSLQSTLDNKTEDLVSIPQNLTFDALSMNLTKQQTSQNSLQSTLANKTEDLASMQQNYTFDALSMNLSKQQTSLNSLQSTLANKTEDLVSIPQNLTFDALSMNLTKQQTSQNSLQSTLANKTEDLASMQQNYTFDALSMNLSKQQTSLISLQSTFTEKTVSDNITNSLRQQFSKSLAPNVSLSDEYVTSKSKSLGSNSKTTTFCRGNQTFEVDNGLSTRCQADEEEEQKNKEENETKEIEQKIFELTNEIEKLRQNNHSLILVVEHYKGEKTNLEYKIVDLSEDIERLKDQNEVHKSQFQQKLTELSLEMKEIINFQSKTANLMEDFEKEKAVFEETIEKFNVVKKIQAEEIARLKEVIDGKNVELEQCKSVSESNQEQLKKSEKIISEMKEMASTLKTSNDELITCNKELNDKNVQLVQQLESKDEANESLAQKLSDFEAKHESLLQEIDSRECRIREYTEENKKLIGERESVLQEFNDLQISHNRFLNELSISNGEYAVKNEQLMEELRSTNEKCESLLQRIVVVEADKERLMNEADTTSREHLEKIDQLMKELQLKSESDDSQLQKLKNQEAINERLVTEIGHLNLSNEDYINKNHRLEEELKSKNEKYETILQKLNNLEAKHECFVKEMDTKESSLRQVENELMAARKDLELKADEIKKLETVSRTCKSESAIEKRHTGSNSKVKISEQSEDDLDDVFFSPLSENKRPATNTKTERPSRIARAKPMKTDTSSARKPKRVTRSAVSTHAQNVSTSPPHANILKNLQSEMNTKSPAVSGGRRLLAQPTAMPHISFEEFADDPQMESESPVSILNRLTGTPAPQRKLRTRRKKD